MSKQKRPSESGRSRLGRAYRRFHKFITLLALANGFSLAFSIWFCSAPTLREHLPRTIVNDVTQLNPVVVEGIAYPRSVSEVQDIVRTHPGPIAIGGGHYSMG